MNAYLNQYKNNQVYSASPEQILIMLYDGAIRFLTQAMQGIEEENIELKSHGIQKAMAIVMEFRMTQANLKKDRQKLQAVQNMLCDLRDTWKEAIVIARNESQSGNAVNAGYQPLKASL